MTRQQLEQLINNNLPDNNNKEISAQLLREVLEEINTSKFHLDEDFLQNQLYQLNETLQQRLQGLPIEQVAKIGTYSFDDAGTEPVDVMEDPDDIIESVTRTKLGDKVLFIDITFNLLSVIGRDIKVFGLIPNGQSTESNQTTTVAPRLVDGVFVQANRIRIAHRRLTNSGVGEHILKIYLK